MEGTFFLLFHRGTKSLIYIPTNEIVEEGAWILDFFEDGLVLFDAHGHQLVAPVIFVKNITGLLLQFFHVRSECQTSLFEG